MANPLIVYGTGAASIILRSATGVPMERVTLQTPNREGLELSLQQEGHLADLGSGASFGRQLVDRGLRPTMRMRWSAALTSTLETWSGSAWGNPQTMDTALAVIHVLNAAFTWPALVQPHLDHSFTFEAQPDPAVPFNLQDNKGVAHTGIELALVGQDVVDMPAWIAG